MSRAITFRFGESAGMRIMAEQGLNNQVCAEIKGDMGDIAHGDIKVNMESIHVQEMQVDFKAIPEVERRGYGFPHIRYAKEGVMTFIEIVIPDSPNYGDVDIQHAPVIESILGDGGMISAEAEIPSKEDVADLRSVSFEIPELMEFSLAPGLGDVIKSLEGGNEDFSLQALEGEFGIPKSLPAHEDMMDFNDLMSGLRKKEKVKVKVKAKSK